MPADRTGHSIFLSYSSKDRDLTRTLAEALERQYGAGSVWWDHALESWGDYEVQIRNALNQARVVVVLWSATAAASDWVKSEAGRANAAHKLVNVRTPDTAWRDIPSPYDQHHVNELGDTDGILRSVAAVWTGRTVRTAIPLHEIYSRQHGQRLIDPKQRTLPRDPRDIGPSELLQAPYEVVGYIDVSDVQTQFFDWCTQPGRAAAGRLIHGPGGLGKTRVMVSLAARLRGLGWTAGFLDRPSDSSAPAIEQRWQAIEQLIHHGGADDCGLLIVIDYAEARQDEVRDLARCLCTRPDEADADKRPVRLVLLARSAGEWWTTLHADTPEIQRVFRRDDPASAIELPAVSTGALRLALFEKSLEAFRPWLAARGIANANAPATGYLTQIETDAEFRRPLAIQMAALVWLRSAGSTTDATSVEELLRRVLGLERDHWRKILGDLDADGRRDLGRAVAQIGIVGGTLTLESTERLLMADNFYQDRRTARVDVDHVRRQLAYLYGGPDGVIVPLEPDLIAEHHVASVGDKELIDGCLHWAENEPPESREQRRRYMLTVLQRATQFEHGPHVGASAVALLEHLVHKHAVTLAAAIVAIMINEPGALAIVVNQSVDRLDTEAVVALNNVLPDRSVVLLDLSMKIAARLVRLARNALAQTSPEQDARTTARAEQLVAHSLNSLGNRLSNLGQREEALTASQEAVATYRRLAEAHPDVFLPALAAGLNNIGVILSNLGRYEEALAASQEAVATRRRLAQARPDDFLPALARGLNNLATRLSQLGRDEEGLAVSQEALEIRRQLAKTHPDVFLAEVASSLNNLSVQQSHLEQHEEAWASSQEAVAMFRRLAETRSDAFLQDLAASLNNLGIRLSTLGRIGEALAPTQEAVAIYRRLVALRADAFLSQLAASLNGLGIRLDEIGRHEEALAAIQEAIEFRRKLAVAHPNAFRPELARSLSVMSDVLAALGRPVESARTAHEALEVLAPFVEGRSTAFRSLARVIVNDVLKYSEAASEPPDLALIERVRRAIGEVTPSE